MMLGPKLVVLAAVLSAVALAAPRNEFVSDDFFAPEESLVSLPLVFLLVNVVRESDGASQAWC